MATSIATEGTCARPRHITRVPSGASPAGLTVRVGRAGESAKSMPRPFDVTQDRDADATHPDRRHARRPGAKAPRLALPSHVKPGWSRAGRRWSQGTALAGYRTDRRFLTAASRPSTRGLPRPPGRSNHRPFGSLSQPRSLRPALASTGRARFAWLGSDSRRALAAGLRATVRPVPRGQSPSRRPVPAHPGDPFAPNPLLKRVPLLVLSETGASRPRRPRSTRAPLSRRNPRCPSRSCPLACGGAATSHRMPSGGRCGIDVTGSARRGE